MFVAPPATGTVIGASEGVGVQGMEITFPEARLRLPSLSFPTFFRSRTNARMMTEGGAAPYVAGYPAAIAAGMPVAALPSAAMLGSANVAGGGGVQAQGSGGAQAQGQSCTSAAGLESKLQQIEAAEDRLNRKLEQLQKCLEQLQTSQNQPPPGYQPAFGAGPPHPSGPAGGVIMQPLPAYAERPAAHFAEPDHFPQPAQWITEPRPATGRITGMRAAPR